MADQPTDHGGGNVPPPNTTEHGNPAIGGNSGSNRATEASDNNRPSSGTPEYSYQWNCDAAGKQFALEKLAAIVATHRGTTDRIVTTHSLNNATGIVTTTNVVVRDPNTVINHATLPSFARRSGIIPVGGELPPRHEPESQPSRTQSPPPPVLALRLCANCGKDDHKLAQCAGPPDSVHGDIAGCPRCNVTTHSYDQCQQIDHESLNGHRYWLLQNRANKPPIRSKYSWILVAAIAKQHHPTIHIVPPWSKMYTRMLMSSHGPKPWETYNYRNESPQLPHDPSTHNADMAIQDFFASRLAPQVYTPHVMAQTGQQPPTLGQIDRIELAKNVIVRGEGLHLINDILLDQEGNQASAALRQS